MESHGSENQKTFSYVPHVMVDKLGETSDEDEGDGVSEKENDADDGMR